MKKTVVVDAPAKINLALDITGRRADGYHFVDMVMQSVSLRDTVTITRTHTEGIYISCDRPRIPGGESNLAHIAARRFLEWFGLPKCGLTIDLQKRIPMQAGMGGGSADAAGVLVGMNALFEVDAPLEELCKLGIGLGADVPFCLAGGTQRVQGIGERMSALPNLPDCHILVAKPEESIPTQECYQRYDQLAEPGRADIAGMVEALENQSLRQAAQKLSNVLEPAAGLEVVEKLRQRMLAGGALGARMTGSGSAVYGLFESKWLAKRCMHKLFDLADGAFLMRPLNGGPFILSERE